MKKSLAIVTFVLGAVTAAVGIATAITSLVNLGSSRHSRFLDD